MPLEIRPTQVCTPVRHLLQEDGRNGALGRKEPVTPFGRGFVFRHDIVLDYLSSTTTGAGPEPDSHDRNVSCLIHC